MNEILVGMDGSASAKRSANLAIEIAACLHWAIRGLYVVDDALVMDPYVPFQKELGWKRIVAGRIDLIEAFKQKGDMCLTWLEAECKKASVAVTGDLFFGGVSEIILQQGLNVCALALGRRYGLKLHLIHGDGLSPADWKYRAFIRTTLRNRVAIWLYRLVPPDIGIPFARAISSSSRNHTSGRQSDFLKDYEAYARQKLSEGYDAVLIGHTHEPSCHQYDHGIYLNTGDFYSHFSYGKLSDGKLTLEYLK